MVINFAESATYAVGEGGRNEVSRPPKQLRQSKARDIDASWCRLMHCIWEVCIQQQSAAIFREDLMRFCDRAEAWISREEINAQHRSMITSIRSGRHYIKIDKPGQIFTLTDKGQKFCADAFGGILVTDE